jgi:hypothetical protein
MKNKITTWMANNRFWSSVIWILLISVLVILVFKAITIFSFGVWIFWRIFDCTKYPLIVGADILTALQQLATGDVSGLVSTVFMFVGGVIIYPFQFIGEVISDMGKGDFAKGFALLLSTYAVVGSIFWSRSTNREGMTLMTVGAIYGVGIVAFLVWTLSVTNNANENNPAVIIVAFVATSAICSIFGIRRYLKQRKVMSGEAIE